MLIYEGSSLDLLDWADLPNWVIKILEYRDTAGDIGLVVDKELNLIRKKSTESIIHANFKRVQEGLRTLEEITQNREFETIRYLSYQLEKDFFKIQESIV